MKLEVWFYAVGALVGLGLYIFTNDVPSLFFGGYFLGVTVSTICEAWP